MFVFVVFAAAEDFLEDVLLFGLSGLGGVRSIAVWWGVWSGDGWYRWCLVWFGGGVAAYAEDLLNEVLGALGHLAAGVDWGRAVEEGDVEGVVGAGGVDEEA